MQYNFFENKGVEEFISKSRITKLYDAHTVNFLPSSVKFPMIIVTYKWTLCKFFNLNKFANNLGLDLFLTSQIVYYTNVITIHIVTGDLQIIRNNVIRKLY